MAAVEHTPPRSCWRVGEVLATGKVTIGVVISTSQSYRRTSTAEIENVTRNGEVVQFRKKGTDLFSRRAAEKMCLSISRLSRRRGSAVLMRGRLSNTKKSPTGENIGGKSEGSTLI